MFLKLFLLLTIVPAMELWLLIKVGGEIGFFPTLMIVVLTGITGAWLAKMEGISVLVKIQHSISQGVIPKAELVNGLLIFVGGAMLLTPGFITDIAGLLMIFPLTRSLFATILISYFERKIKEGTVHFSYHSGPTESKTRINDDSVIDADFEDK
ncbi:MAG TPA: FxsA family protein [bacterium]|nr:FxsA family protein [bacterium]